MLVYRWGFPCFVRGWGRHVVHVLLCIAEYLALSHCILLYTLWEPKGAREAAMGMPHDVIVLRPREARLKFLVYR